MNVPLIYTFTIALTVSLSKIYDPENKQTNSAHAHTHQSAKKCVDIWSDVDYVILLEAELN